MPVKNIKINLCWNKASEKAIQAYSQLANKKCKISLQKFKKGEIDASRLYDETVHNLEDAATTCIPKHNPSPTKRHNVPLWRERIAIYRNHVDYWINVQFLNGGPKKCSEWISRQLRLVKSQYKRQIRILRREICENTAEYVTTQNCFRKLFRKQKRYHLKLLMVNGENSNLQCGAIIL